MAACVPNVAEYLSGYVRTGIADFNRLLSDKSEISNYKEDKHFIQDLRLLLWLLKIQAFLDVMLVVWCVFPSSPKVRSAFVIWVK